MVATRAASKLDRTDSTMRFLLWSLAAIGAAAIFVMRIWLGQALPLWIDETWTAMIVSQASWGDFWREVWLDCNAPVYYTLVGLWAGVAGLSNAAIRAPSLLFMAAAAAVPLLWKIRSLSLEARVTWAALIFFWWPGIAMSLDARSYALLLLVSCLQTVAFARLLDDPSLRRALIWSSIASTAILTQYYAIYVVVVQGLIYLYLHRGRALRTWVAAAAFLPAMGWLIYHLPRLLEYARPDVAWYGTNSLYKAVGFALSTIGPPQILFAIFCDVILLIALLAGRRSRSGQSDEPHMPARHLWWTAAAGLLVLMLALAIGMVRPSLTARYLTPVVPMSLLGLVLVARMSKRAHLGYVMLIGLFLAAALTPAALDRRLRNRAFYGGELASDYLMRARPDRLVFAWDHPASRILHPNSLAQVGGFFFHRAHHPVETVTVTLRPGEDPHPQLLKAAAGASRPAILWLYNGNRESAARYYLPMTYEFPGWRCRNATREGMGVLACAPRRQFDDVGDF